MVDVLDCGLEVSMFEFQSCYYVHFRTNTVGKGMNPIIPLSYRLNSITAVLQQGLVRLGLMAHQTMLVICLHTIKCQNRSIPINSV